MKLAWLLLALSWPLFVSADIQKWVDSNGQVHYGEQPPEGTRLETIDTSGSNVIDTSDMRRRAKALDKQFESRRQYEKRQRQAQEKQQKKDAVYCQRAKQRLGIYRQKVPVFTTKADGSRDYVDDEERRQVIASLKRKIRRYCH